MHESIQIHVPGGSFKALIARPVAAKAPVVVVLPEVFGVNADMRQTCTELANQGYIAICPDLFWRMERGVELTDQTQAELDKATALYQAFDLDAGVADIVQTVSFARIMPSSTGKVGLLGFCLGGLMSFLTTARVGADASVAYYPGNADQHLDAANHIDSPMLVHLAQEDEYIPKEAQRRIADALIGRPLVHLHSYPGCSHAFARHRGLHYDADAALRANERSAAFLAAYLS